MLCLSLLGSRQDHYLCLLTKAIVSFEEQSPVCFRSYRQVCTMFIMIHVEDNSSPLFSYQCFPLLGLSLCIMPFVVNRDTT